MSRRLKKAEMGVGTLIVFIAMILVAAVAAGVLIQTSGSLQEKALITGSQARAQVSTNARVIEVSATDGQDGDLNDVNAVMKLAAGSDAVKLADVVYTVNTYQRTATLVYKGVNGSLANNASGYNTYNPEELGLVSTSAVTLNDDLDSDGSADTVLLNNSHALFTLSTGGPINVTPDSGTFVIGQTPSAVGVAIAHSNGTIYGYWNLSATIATNATVVADDTFTVTPITDLIGTGFFTVEYLQQGSNFVSGNLQRGDVIKLYFESPGDISTDEEIRLNFIPKIGTPTLTNFITPEVFSTERTYLYP